MRPSAFAAALRRKLLAQPGITARPVCGACGRQVEPAAFGWEYCRECEADRARASEAWEAERWAEVNGHPTPAPEFPIFGSDEAAEPFLADDEAGAPAAPAATPPPARCEGCLYHVPAATLTIVSIRGHIFRFCPGCNAIRHPHPEEIIQQEPV